MRNDDAYAGRPGAAPVGTGAATAHIAPLKELKDYKVASDDPDVRGWEVVARDGLKIGDVHDLLVDTSAMRVRYLDVELDRGLLANVPVVPGMAHTGTVGEHRHVLVPIGTARLDEGDDDRIYLDTMDSHDLAILPPYDHKAFSREYETGMRQSWDRNYTPAPDRDFYAGDLYDQERFYGPRRKKRGLFR